MAKEDQVQDAVMDTGKLRGIIKLAVAGDEESGGKKLRLPIMLGMDNDGAAVVSVAKKGSPKKLRNDAIKDITAAKLTKQIAADAAHLYFGYAFATDEAPTVLRVQINKKPQGEGKLAVAVLKRVRAGGFGEVVFEVNEKLEEMGEAEDGIAAGDSTGTPPPSPPPPPPQAPVYDAAQLQKMLAALIPRIPGAAANDAARLDSLKKIATMVGVNIKTGNLNTAAAGLAELSRALDAASTVPPPPPPPGTAAAIYAKSRQAWVAAHQRMIGDIDKLRAELVATYQDQGLAGDVQKRYDDVIKPLLSKIDESLARKLDAIAAAPAADARAALVTEAKEIIGRYTTALTDPIIAELDANPFVPLAIQKTLSATLTGISAAIH